MKKRLLVFLLLGIVSTTFAGVFPDAFSAIQSKDNSCGLSPMHTDAGFCAGFKAVVMCQCESGYPHVFCTSVHKIYNLIMVKYQKSAPHQINQACSDAYNNHTPPWTQSIQECRDQWHCYIDGAPQNPDDGACANTAPC